jgi:hypothetical protein
MEPAGLTAIGIVRPAEAWEAVDVTASCSHRACPALPGASTPGPASVRRDRSVDPMRQNDRIDHFPAIETAPPGKLKTACIIPQIHELISYHQTLTSRARHTRLLCSAIAFSCQAASRLPRSMT